MFLRVILPCLSCATPTEQKKKKQTQVNRKPQLNHTPGRRTDARRVQIVTQAADTRELEMHYINLKKILCDPCISRSPLFYICHLICFNVDICLAEGFYFYPDHIIQQSKRVS